ncbi:hypothetical protein GGR54DRAFT_629004 [Hypoxylon sp. NC1633]|nr:hypothetical protein GGR54DRAFT_629004 [Hypoxylon sp. NC1633]
MPRRRIPITFTYKKNGTYPPIYVAGTFSDPPWRPQEMDVSIDQHGGHMFTKQITIDGASAEIQYKFRIGSGNWWALDEAADTTTDGQGNVNNILRISVDEPRVTGAKSPNPQVNKLKGSSASSGVQTSDIANTAAEVADSAQMIDAETTEPEISNYEAGKIGIRRLSSTPISQVAETSMEVSTTAAGLDIDDSISDEEIDGENSPCPMFSHEYAGSPGHEADYNNFNPQLEDKSAPHAGNLASEIEDLDFNDPELEAFPSNDRASILASLRRISTTIDVDRTAVDGIPLSPLITISQPLQTVDSLDKLDVSQGSTNLSSRNDPNLRPDDTRKSPSPTAIGARTTSMSSLGSINEDDEKPNNAAANESKDGAGTSAPFIQHPGPSWGSVFEHAISGDDDDEGIAMNTESKRVAGETQIYPPPSTSKQPSLFGSKILGMVQPGHDESSLGSREAIEDDDGQGSPSFTTRNTPGTYQSDSSHEEIPEKGEGDTQSTSMASRNLADLRKRTAGKSTPVPPNHRSQDRNNYPDWFEVCFKIVFVKWIGGLATWLYGRRHRAFMAAATAAVVVGVGVLWQKPIRI